MPTHWNLATRYKGLLFAAITLLLLAVGVLFPKAASAYGSVLYTGESLANGAKLESPSGQFAMIMQGDGNLVNYFWPSPYWASNTANNSGARLVMQGDGNLVIYRANGQPIWATGTVNQQGAHLILQDDGNLVLRNGAGAVLWSPNAVPTKLASGQLLRGNRSWQIFSPDRRYRMVMQTDGNVVLYDRTVAIWAKHGAGAGATFEMQTDGNLVLYNATHTAIWATNKFGPNGSYLEGQNDGNFVVYTPTRGVLWSTRGDNPTPPSNAAQLARQILDLRAAGRISIQDYSSNPTSDRADRSLASQQLEDIAAGKLANLSTRCSYASQLPRSIQPDIRILQFLADLGTQYNYKISVLFGQCHTSANSNHHKGTAVDFGCAFSTGTPDNVGRKYGISHNYENCPNDGHYHYSVGGN